MDKQSNFSNSSNDKSAAERERPMLSLEMTDIDGGRYHRIIRPDGSMGRWVADENAPRIKPKYTPEY